MLDSLDGVAKLRRVTQLAEIWPQLCHDEDEGERIETNEGRLCLNSWSCD
uniref:Uncharacterized protein n=1 Tax=Kalanchoe fedtschenkoi TaxID=63787 RepID=A0A7N0V844_KALFE